MITISPSLLSANFSNLEPQMNLLKECGITNIHYDVMDGSYVPPISFGSEILKQVHGRFPSFLYDVHMMTVNADAKIKDFVGAGADIITVHYEACTHLDKTIYHIKSYDVKAGVVLNPATPVSVLEDILPSLDIVLLMSVNPGYGGQKYIPYVTEKINKLHTMIKKTGKDIIIQVDGGVCKDTIKQVVEAGATNLVAGSAVFSGDIKKNIEELRNIIK